MIRHIRFQRFHTILAVAATAGLGFAALPAHAGALLVTNWNATTLSTDTTTDLADIGLDHTWGFVPVGTSPNGIVVVGDGSPVTWTNTGDLWIASNFNAASPSNAAGTGSVSINPGSTLDNAGLTYIGFDYYANVNGTMDVSAYGTFHAHRSITVGWHGSMTIEGMLNQDSTSVDPQYGTVSNSLNVEAGSGAVGTAWGGGGVLTVQGPAAVVNSPDVQVDAGGLTKLNLLDGATINSDYAEVGSGYIAGNTAQNHISTWNVSSYVRVAPGLGTGQGTLTVADGGLISASRAFVGDSYDSTKTGLLTVNSGGAVEVSNPFFQPSVEMYAGSGIDLSAGGKMLIGDGSVNGVTAGTLQVGHNGTLKGEGTVTGNVFVTGGGTVSPGHSPGTLNITGNLTLDPTGGVTMQIAGPGTGQFDVLNVAGALDFGGGQLNLEFLNGYAPTPGDLVNLQLFTATNGITGTFDSVNISGLADNLAPDIDFSQLSTGELSFATHYVPEPGTLAVLAIGTLAVLMRRRVQGTG